MSFADIPGQERAKTILQNGLRRDRLSHAYIFCGPVGTGRGRMAKTFAQALFCRESVDDACGHCPECRKVEHGNHPNVHWIEPDGISIKIDQIRELQQRLAYRSAASAVNVYVVREADKMTVQAANSLLKFLEEPLSPTIAVLIAENGHSLIPTIRSRAQWVPFVPMAPRAMAETLFAERLPRELVLPAVHLASGIDAARRLTQADWFAETRNVMIQLMKDSLSKTPFLSGVQQHVMRTEASDHMDTLVDLAALWFKDLILVSVGKSERIVYIDQADWLSRHAFHRSAGQWVRCVEAAVEARKRLRFHANPQLALERFLYSVQQSID
jgi:DNA polymerase-3 subunit delta'